MHNDGLQQMKSVASFAERFIAMIDSLQKKRFVFFPKANIGLAEHAREQVRYYKKLLDESIAVIESGNDSGNTQRDNGASYAFTNCRRIVEILMDYHCGLQKSESKDYLQKLAAFCQAEGIYSVGDNHEKNVSTAHSYLIEKAQGNAISPCI